MKCDLCKGTGKLLKPWYSTTGAMTGMTGDICFMCDGKGEIKGHTNEDWVRQASTEELAEWIVDEIKNMAYSFLLKEFSDKDCNVLKGYYCEWLKEERK